jgi:hypothetical protein
MGALTIHTFDNQRGKEKRKEMTKRKLKQAIESQTKAKNKIT